MATKEGILLPEEIFKELADSSSKVYAADHDPKNRSGEEVWRKKASVLWNSIRENVKYTLSPRERRRYFAIGEYLFSYGADLNEQVAKKASFMRRMRMHFVNAMGKVKEKFDSIKRWYFENPVVRYIKKALLALGLFLASLGSARGYIIQKLEDFFLGFSLDNARKLFGWILVKFNLAWHFITKKAERAYDFITGLFPDENGNGGTLGELVAEREADMRDVFRSLRVRLIEKIRGTSLEPVDRGNFFASRNTALAVEAGMGRDFLETGMLDTSGGTAYRAALAALMNEYAMKGFAGNLAVDESRPGVRVSGDGEYSTMDFGTTGVTIFHKILGKGVDWSDDASVSNAFTRL